MYYFADIAVAFQANDTEHVQCEFKRKAWIIMAMKFTSKMIPETAAIK